MRETRSDVKEYLGIYIGSQLGVCIIPHFMLDHGGTTFKGVMTLVNTEQSKTLNCECIAVGAFKESTEILRKHLLPEINPMTKTLRDQYVVTVE